MYSMRGKARARCKNRYVPRFRIKLQNYSYLFFQLLYFIYPLVPILSFESGTYRIACVTISRTHRRINFYTDFERRDRSTRDKRVHEKNRAALFSELSTIRLFVVSAEKRSTFGEEFSI